MESILKTNKSQQGVANWQAILVLAFFLFSFFPVWKGLINAWSNSEDYGHAFFIPPISLYLIWMKKDELHKAKKAISIYGFCLFIGVLLVYLVAFFAKITTVTAVAMIISIITLIWTFYGVRVTKLLSFPLFFLFFMVPIPSQIYSAATIPLQLFVSKASAMLAMLIGIPVYREGNVLHLPEQTMQVVEACSGLRSIISLFTFSLIFGYLAHRSNINRSLLTAASLPVALLINIIRILIMLTASYFYKIDLTSGALHTYFGISIFLIAILILYFSSFILSATEK